jgi:hypothetical protein
LTIGRYQSPLETWNEDEDGRVAIETAWRNVGVKRSVSDVGTDTRDLEVLHLELSVSSSGL